MFGWRIQRSDSGGSGMRIASPDFVRNPRCAVYSGIRRRVSSPLCGAQKNALRLLWSRTLGLVRPACAPGSRSVLRRCAHLPRIRGSARSVPKLRTREARAAGVSGRQPVLYQALCPLRGPALSHDDDQGPGRGTQPGLGHGQDAGEAVHGGAACESGYTGTQGDRHRRDLDLQGPHLPHRGERSDSGTPDLVRRRAWRSSTRGWARRKARASVWR